MLNLAVTGLEVHLYESISRPKSAIRFMRTSLLGHFNRTAPNLARNLMKQNGTHSDLAA